MRSSALVVALLFSVATELLALSPSKLITQYTHQSWATRQGLPQNSVRSLVQTRDGYIWLGTGAGLVRFDGVRFTVFDKANTPAIHDDDIRALAEDSEGNLWIGTYSGGLTRKSGSEFTFFGTARGLPSEMIRGLMVDRAGNLWIATFGGGLARFRDGKFITLTTRDGLVDDRLMAILEDSTGALWAGTIGGVSRIRDGVITSFTTDDGLTAMFVVDIIEDRKEAIWFATYGGGIARFADGRFTTISTAEGLADDRVFALEEDHDGNLWIGLYGGGLQRITPDGRLEGFTPAEGLLGDTVFDIMEDREGSIWVGTFDGGLNQLQEGEFTTFTSSEGLSGDKVYSVAPSRNGGVWIASEGGGVDRITNGKVEPMYTTRKGLSSDNTVAVLEDSRGDLWIGSLDGQLHRISNGQILTYGVADGLGSDEVWALYEDTDGVVWLGTRSGGITRYDGREFITINADDGLLGNAVRVVLKDSKGIVWVGTDAGISRLVNGRIENLTSDDGLPNKAILAFHEDADGVIWIGTRGGGLARWSNGSLFSYSRSNGLPDDTAFRILEDDAGYLWISSLRGVYRVSRAELNEFAAGKRRTLRPTLYDSADGMEESHTTGGSQPAGAKSADGRFWFPTVKGVVVVDPAHLPGNTVPPPVYIEQVVVDRTVYPLGSARFPAGSRNVEIHYTAPSFQAPEKVRFMYRLEGFDEEWIDAGSRRVAYYTNLPPGEFTFSVYAFNNDGVRSEGIASTRFGIGRFFYQSVWFYLLIAALLGTFAWLILRARLKVMRAEAHARAAELERTLIEAQKMESLGQMASGIAHDFNNTMMTALPWADVLANRSEEPALVLKASKHIREAVLRASGVTRQLLDFAQPRRPEKRPVDLAGLLHDHLRLIRPSLSPEIQVRVNVRGTDLIVHADPSQLQQVVLNLSLNARDAMPRGGELEFELRRTTRRDRDEWGVDLPDAVVLRVSDSGSGIDESRRVRIFDPFFTTKEVGKGSGLGLSVVHRIVEEHGGRIVLGSSHAAGTTFYVVLPAYYPSEEEVQPEVAVGEADGGKLEGLGLMMIDDEVDLAEGVKAILEMEGAEVTLHGSGAAGLADIDAGRQPDLIILDLGMPGMTGDEVHAEVRKRLPQLPIIISSGYGDRARLDPLLADGHTGYKQKPYPLDDLIEEITRRVHSSRKSTVRRQGF